MQLYIVPTYECGLHCEACYSKKYLAMFPDYLSWGNFIKLYNTFCSLTTNILFIGGEATCWRFINEAILFLKNKDKHITLFSNGLKTVSVMPNNVVINGNNLFSRDIKMEILNNIYEYRKNKAHVTLRFNINEYFENYLQDAIDIAKEYADAISISVLFPVKRNNKTIGKLTYQLAKGLIINKSRVKISRATPLCLFTSEQRTYLEENCGLKGVCSLPTKSIVVNPDGKTIQPCVELPIFKEIACYSNLDEKSLFDEEIKCLIEKAKDDCSACSMFINKKCCGGCLSYK